ncbi:hypothetical protein ANN_21101 [Periplaneta americana]|uniref:Uncharacterized protein n=1 Tax=Periplaneta americana TaxID=6978 RepID=A0ABQ8SFK7_PERAM|nr:hypothetical protein ANN_21101 [Periplaneta americana]
MNKTAVFIIHKESWFYVMMECLGNMETESGCLDGDIEQSCAEPVTCQCAIEKLLLHSFSSLSFQEKSEIIENDETTDITTKPQLSTTVRYVTKTGSIEERFLGFKDVSNGRTAIALTEHVFQDVQEFHCDKKLVIPNL